MSWSLPVTLKGKLSNTWTRCLEHLANSNFFPLSSYTFLEGRLANEHTSFDTPCQSWESVLNILGEDDAVDQDGELKLLPVFLSLPPVMQLRFVFFLQSNISQITSRTINTFLEQIENSQKNMWMKEAVCQLRNTVAQRCIETDNVTEINSTKYTFTLESQSAFQVSMSKLTNTKKCPWELCPASSHLGKEKDEAAAPVTNIPTSKSNTDSATVRTYLNIPVMNSGIRKTSHSLLPCDDKAINIIVIDDESTDSVITVMDHSPLMNVNIDKDNFSSLSDQNNWDMEKSDNVFSSDLDKLDNRNSKQLASQSILVKQKCLTASNTFVSGKPNPMNCQQSPVDSDIHTFAMNNEKLKERKRKFTEIVIQEEDIEHPASKKGIFVNRRQDMETGDSAAELTSAPSDLLLQPKSDAYSEIKLPRNIMVHLDGIREACSRKENAGVIAKEIMDCFLDMDVAEIEIACTYLGLAQFSEKALINFCDSVPWSSFGSESSTVLLNCCFSCKMRNLESPASRILLMSLDSVSRIQPKAVINVLADVLAISKSGEFQCQVLTSICKEFLPLDCFDHLIRQLSKEAVVVNEHLVSVLQALVDKCPSLATDSLSCFHSVLTTTCQELSASAKFGKLLMGVLTKYGDKLSSEQFTAVCVVVETHNSSFRKPLLALVKRLTRLS